jgi:acyl-CoA synthetase (AMP-forming)/AMP-acid ligase II
MQQVSYGELDQMTEHLAIKLCHLGVRNNVVVGILMDRCLEYVVSYIAILRAGLHFM